jgi:hypothetical protein
MAYLLCKVLSIPRNIQAIREASTRSEHALSIKVLVLMPLRRTRRQSLRVQLNWFPVVLRPEHCARPENSPNSVPRQHPVVGIAGAGNVPDVNGLLKVVRRRVVVHQGVVEVFRADFLALDVLQSAGYHFACGMHDCCLGDVVVYIMHLVGKLRSVQRVLCRDGAATSRFRNGADVVGDGATGSVCVCVCVCVCVSWELIMHELLWCCQICIVCMLIFSSVCMYTYIHVCVCMHTYMYMYTHTYIYT